MSSRGYVVVAGLSCLLTIILTSLPPFSHLTQRTLAKAPPFAFLQTQKLLSSAHESLVLTAAIDVDLFTFIHHRSQGCSSSSSSTPKPSPPTGILLIKDFFSTRSCVPAAVLSSGLLGEVGGGGVGGSERITDAALLATIITPAVHHDFFQALVALGALEACTPLDADEGNGRNRVEAVTAKAPVSFGYALTTMSERYLVAEYPTCSSTTGSTTGSARNENYLGGMGLIANSPQVLKSLLDLPKVLRSASDGTTTTSSTLSDDVDQGDEGGERNRFSAEKGGEASSLRMATAVASDEEDAQLWTIFADHSDTFVLDVAKRVAKEISVAVRFRSDAKKVLFDLGGGSGEFVAQVAQQLTRQSRTTDIYPVLFDLPAVVHTSKQRRTRLNLQPKLSYVGGNVFNSEQSLKDLRSAAFSNGKDVEDATSTIVMLNSFLQHFTSTQCTGILQDLVLPLLDNTEEVEEPQTSSSLSDDPLVVSEGSIVAVVEVVKPLGPYNPWTELTTMPRVFSVMLAALTKGKGLVRTEKEYLDILHEALCADDDPPQGAISGRSSVEREKSSHSTRDSSPKSKRSCRHGIRTIDLFPMPATLFLVRIQKE